LRLCNLQQRSAECGRGSTGRCPSATHRPQTPLGLPGHNSENQPSAVPLAFPLAHHLLCAPAIFLCAVCREGSFPANGNFRLSSCTFPELCPACLRASALCNWIVQGLGSHPPACSAWGLTLFTLAIMARTSATGKHNYLAAGLGETRKEVHCRRGTQVALSGGNSPGICSPHRVLRNHSGTRTPS
jgi:hypothetical protein